MHTQKLYLGTWQFGGQFKRLSDDQIRDLLNFAWESGVYCFDTAAVYGNGHVETLLGEVLPKESIIVTKVPAVVKPQRDSAVPPIICYPRNWVLQSVRASLKRLRRDSVDTILLHNWARTWHNAQEVDAILLELKHEGLVKKIGISLPDGYNTSVPEALRSIAEAIEAPYNPLNEWIMPQIPHFQTWGSEVLLRSVFLQGMRLWTDSASMKKIEKNDLRKEKFATVRQYSGARPEVILRELSSLPVSLVIGMTTREQITQNLKLLREEEES